MVVGDFSIEASGLNSAITFTPAGTDMFMILTFTNGGSGSTETPSIRSNAVNNEIRPANANAPPTSIDYGNMKFLIDNANPIRCPANDGNFCSVFSMVQVQ